MMDDIEMTIAIELQEVEKNLELLFDLVTQGKISNDDYDKLSAYPYKRKNELNKQLQGIKNGA